MRRFPSSRMVVILRQLAVLTRAGIPLLRALERLAAQERLLRLRRALEDVVTAVRAGESLSDGMERDPRLFDPVEVAMVRAGEAGGTLVAALERMARRREKLLETRNRIVGALAYPSVVLLVAVVIVSGLLILIVPRFQEIFATQLRGQPLPALTRAVIAAAEFLRTRLPLMILLAAGLQAGGMALLRSRSGRRCRDHLLLRLPVAGALARRLAAARVARTLGAAIEGGVPLLSALSMAGATSGNGRIAEGIAVVAARARAGDSLAAALRTLGIFPDLLADMVEIGEEAGTLPEMLGRAADVFDSEVDRTVAAGLTLLEPALIVILAGTVGTLVIAMFLPLVRMIQLLG